MGIAVRYRFGDQTAETIESLTIVDLGSQDLAFDTSKYREIWPLRFDDDFAGYAT
jgi:hypothetical protein